MSSSSDIEISQSQNLKPGIWLLASFCTSCDQTVASLIEVARFYPSSFSPAFSEALQATLPRSRKNNAQAIEQFAALFEPAEHSALLQKRPDCGYAAEFVKTRQQTSASDYLGWILHSPEANQSSAPSRIWGALELFIMDYELFAPPEIEGQELDYYTLTSQGRQTMIDAGFDQCVASLDAVASAAGLGVPTLIALNSQLLPSEPTRADRPVYERARWGEDWLPYCVQGAALAASEAEMERFDIETAAARAPSAASRPPRV